MQVISASRVATPELEDGTPELGDGTPELGDGIPELGDGIPERQVGLWDLFISCPLHFFPFSLSSACLHPLFLCVLFHSCSSNPQEFGKTLVHECPIF